MMKGAFGIFQVSRVNIEKLISLFISFTRANMLHLCQYNFIFFFSLERFMVLVTSMELVCWAVFPCMLF